MRRKALEQRRQEAIALAATDRANRCGYCLLALGKQLFIVVGGVTARFCSEDCLDAALDYEQAIVARREKGQ